jgi:hypothetical protein
MFCAKREKSLFVITIEASTVLSSKNTTLKNNSTEITTVNHVWSILKWGQGACES